MLVGTGADEPNDLIYEDFRCCAKADPSRLRAGAVALAP
jgi:hypothetical protein